MMRNVINVKTKFLKLKKVSNKMQIEKNESKIEIRI